MDEYDSVRHKVDAIFRELVGEQASSLEADLPARHANDVLGQALAEGMDPLKADEVALHLVDWNADAAFLVSATLYPDKFTPAELRAGIDLFLSHVPAHVLAAARLAGHSIEDTFLEDNAT